MIKFYKYLIFGVVFSFLVCFLQKNNLKAQNISELLTALNEEKSTQKRTDLCVEIGLLYQKERAYQKSVEYFEKATNTAKTDEKDKILTYLGQAQSLQGDYTKAIITYKELLEIRKNNQTKARQTLGIIADLEKRSENYKEALAYYEDILKNYPPQNQEQSAQIYNNIGFLYRKLEDKDKSLEILGKALTSAKESQKPQAIITTLLNIGVTHSTHKNYKVAQDYYNQALNIAKKNNLAIQTAETHNYISANNWLQTKNEIALENVEQAIKIAEPLQADDILLVSYKLLSDIYQQKGEFREAQEAYKMYEKTKSKRQEKIQKDQKNALETQVNIEKKESEIKTLLADKDRQTSALKQSELEKQQQQQVIVLKQQELDLFKANQAQEKMKFANQALEQKRIEQMLEIAQRKLQEDKQNQEIAELQNKQLLKDAQLKEKESQEKEQKARTALLEKDKILQDQQLKDEKMLRESSNWIISLGGICLLLVLLGLGHTFWTNSKLTKQKKEIESKNLILNTKNDEIAKQAQELEQKNHEMLAINEELHQNQEELEAQREYIETTNKDLQKKNQKLIANEEILKKAMEKLKASEMELTKINDNLAERDKQITNSIKAALTIQEAILPYQQKLDSLLNDFFVIYRPKDVVSGDFYWLNEVEDRTFLIAVDCTGHGVPGAFMSLIANTLLDKIIRVWHIFSPKDILNQMQHEVSTVLRQDDTGNNNGMDMAVICMQKNENGSRNITFAGAKRPFYFILPNTNTVGELEGDRKSIGGFQNADIQFTNKTIILPKNSLLYIGSDGMPDQNNEKRKRFTETKLKNVLLENATLDMNTQKENLENAIITHMTNTTQRDDMLWIGVRI